MNKLTQKQIAKIEQNYAQRIFDDLSNCKCLELHGCIHEADFKLYKKKWGVK